MKKMINKTLLASAVAVVCAFSANVASAQTVFADFIVDPSGPLGRFTADKLTGNYTEIAVFDAASGTFTANLVWTAAAFVTNDGTRQLTGTTTGLNNDYGLYALYSANGTFSTNAATNRTDFTFTPGTGNLSLFLDPTNNTVYTETDGATFTSVGEGDDIVLATGQALSGNGFIDPNNSQCTGGIFCGAFGSTTSFELTDPAGTGFFVAPSPFYQLSFQSGQLNTFTPSGRQLINGSLDVSFNDVPEPASLALLGLGLFGLGLARRRKQA